MTGSGTRAGAASKHGILWARVNLERRRRRVVVDRTLCLPHLHARSSAVATAAFLVLDYRGRRRIAHTTRGGGKRASDQARAHYDFMSI